MANGSASERLIGRVEGCAAAALMFITALTFTSVFTRYVFVAPIPDAFDISRLMMGIMIAWGIATCGFRDDHIQMDVLWSVLGRGGRRILDLFATSASLLFMALFTWVLAPLHLKFLQVLVFIGVVAFLVQLLDTILKKTHRALHQRFGIYLVLITTNCIILAVPLLNASSGAGAATAFSTCTATTGYASR